MLIFLHHSPHRARPDGAERLRTSEDHFRIIFSVVLPFYPCHPFPNKSVLFLWHFCAFSVKCEETLSPQFPNIHLQAQSVVLSPRIVKLLSSLSVLSVFLWMEIIMGFLKVWNKNAVLQSVIRPVSLVKVALQAWWKIFHNHLSGYQMICVSCPELYELVMLGLHIEQK